MWDLMSVFCFFFSSRRRHTRSLCDWSSDVCSSDLTAALLPPGNYVVIVNAAGFGEGRIGAVRVCVTETTTLDVTLKPSGVSEKVEVSAEVGTVNTQNATTGQTIEQQGINGFPLATPNFQQPLTLAAA